MNRLIVKLILVVLCALILGIGISIDPGYVFIRFSRFEYESGLWVTLALIGFVIFTLWLIMTLIGISFEIFGKINPFSQQRKHRLGEKGMRELAEGNWSTALKHLRVAAKAKNSSLSYYLGAAEAANELGEYDKSNAFIEAACDNVPKAKMAIGLTFANLLLQRQDYDKALAVATELQSIKSNHPPVIKLLYTIYFNQENWTAVNQLLPALAKYQLLPENTLTKLEEYTWSAVLKESFANNKDQPVLALEQLKKVWDSLSNKARSSISTIETYIQLLCSLNAPQEAEKLLQKAINTHYCPELIYLYGQINGDNLTKQISLAEQWLTTHQKDPVLLLTLGKLCQRNQLWGKAKEYLEKSIQLKHSPESYFELAGYYAEHGDTQKSNQLFRQGLQQTHQNLYLTHKQVN